MNANNADSVCGFEAENKIYTLEEITDVVAPIARKYAVCSIYIFGSYARGSATTDSDLDFLVVGGEGFKPALVYAMGEDFRTAFNKNVDIFEIHEVTVGSDFYNNVMKERRRVA